MDSVLLRRFSGTRLTSHYSMLLELLSYIGIIAGFCGVVFSIAAGLYYLSEQVEAHTVVTKRILLYLVYFALAAHILLWIFDGLPFWQTLISITTNVFYLTTTSQFPVVDLWSSQFLGSCLLTLVNHFVWFNYFGNDSKPPYTIYSYNSAYVGPTHPPFKEIASFFGLLVWLIPFLLFISLSANDFVLPTSQERGKRHASIARAIVERVASVFVN